MKRIDLTGIRFNQLVAIKFTGETKINGNAMRSPIVTGKQIGRAHV